MYLCPNGVRFPDRPACSVVTILTPCPGSHAHGRVVGDVLVTVVQVPRWIEHQRNDSSFYVIFSPLTCVIILTRSKPTANRDCFL
jgi:hypothetical protein